MSHPRDVEKTLVELQETFVRVSSEAQRISNAIKEQLDSIIAKCYAFNRAQVEKTMVSESALQSKDDAQSLAKGVDAVGNKLNKRSREIMQIEQSLELLQGSKASPEAVEQLGKNVDKLANLQRKLIAKTFEVGYSSEANL